MRVYYVSLILSKKRSIYFEDFIRESDDIQPYRKGGGLGHKNETFSRVFMQRVAYRVTLLHSLLELTRTMAAAAAAGGGFAGDVPIIHAENLVSNIRSINYRFVSSSSP